MRTLGIDFGERRVGLAISDPAGRVAVALETVERRSDRALIGLLEELCRREAVESLVVGYPRNLDGSRGAAADRAARFAARLARATGLPYELIDESLTSVEAAERQRRLGRRRRTQPLDAAAAQIVLQDALDQRAG